MWPPEKFLRCHYSMLKQRNVDFCPFGHFLRLFGLKAANSWRNIRKRT
jgi:hypothetical protein